jgi:hypothetical protein
LRLVVVVIIGGGGTQQRRAGASFVVVVVVGVRSLPFTPGCNTPAIGTHKQTTRVSRYKVATR